MMNQTYTLTKQLLRVGEEWQDQISTAGELRPEDISEIKDQIYVIEKKVFYQENLE